MSPISLDDRQRLRRSRLRPKPFLNVSDRRGNGRRLFARSNSSVPPQTSSSRQEEGRRRSFLAKPPAPGAARRVMSVIRDPKRGNDRRKTSSRPKITAGTGYEHNDQLILPLNNPIALSDQSSVQSSLPASAESVEEEQSVPLEVDASEISDATSNERAAKTVQSTPEETSLQDDLDVKDGLNDDLMFIDDVGSSSFAFNLVGEEEDEVPEAPASKLENERLANYEERIRMLQTQLEEERSQNVHLNEAVEQQAKEYSIIVNSLRARTSQSSSELEALTKQLRDTKRRLNRKVRDLEDEIENQKQRNAEQLEQHQEIESYLRSELEKLSAGGVMHRFERTGSHPTLPQRRKRVADRQTYEAPASRGSSGTDSSGGSQNGQYTHFSRVRSTGNVHENHRRLDRPDSYSSLPRSRSSRVRRSSSAAHDATPLVDVTRKVTKNSLLRRSFVAHIHSSKYRSAREAWDRFLGGADGPVSPDQFSRAVRGLAIAATAKDHEIEKLRKEVGGEQENDTGVVSWFMFARFYNNTVGESS